MNPQQRGTALSLIIFCATIIGIVIFVALWDYRVLVALCLLGLGMLMALVWLGLTVARSLNEMSLRQKRYRQSEETPLTLGSYPTHLQAGEQPYSVAMPWHARAVPHDEQGHYE